MGKDMQNEDLKKKTITSHIYDLLKKNKIDVAYFLLLLFYFTYCTSNHFYKPDLASGLALSTFFYVIVKFLPKVISFVFNIPLSIFIISWFLLKAYLKQYHSIPGEAGAIIGQSNLHEILAYIRTIISTAHLIMACFIFAIIPLSLFINRASYLKNNIIIAITLILLSILTLYNNKSAILRQYNFNIFQIIKEIEFLKDNVDKYTLMLKERSELLAQYNLTSSYNGTIIFIIGESETPRFMNDYGFFLNDTEYTNNYSNTIKYSDTVTTFPRTMIAIPDFLTLGDYNNGISYSDAKSYDIISVFKSIGVKSYWISMQESASIWSSPIVAIADSADVVKFLQKIDTQNRYDESLAKYLNETIQEDNNKKIIFLHLQGNHYIYSGAYPKEFDKFKYAYFNNKKFYGKKSLSDVNDYVNSVDYIDYVLSQIYNISDSVESPVIVIYHSDHGESVKTGGHGDSIYAYDQAFIPMYLHFNKKFIEEYPELYKNATANEDKPYYTLYDPYTIFDLIGLKDKNGNTPDFADRNKSIFNRDYKVGERIVKVVHTPDKYNTNNDYYENTHALMMAIRNKYNNSNATDNIYANDVSSLGGLIEAKPLFYGVSTKILLGDKNYGALVCDAKDECDYNLTISEYLQASKGFLRKPDLHLLFFIENNSTISDNPNDKNGWVANLQKAITDNKIDVHNIKFVAYNADVKSKFLNALKSSEFDSDFNNDSIGIENSNGVVNFDSGEKIKVRADINSSDENFLSLFPLETHTSLVVSYPSMM